MRINHNGNVGIGTQSPDAKLDVEGSLQADTITAETTIYPYRQNISTNGAVDVEYFTLPSTRAGEELDSAIAMVNDVSGEVDIYRFDYSTDNLAYGYFVLEDEITGFTSPNDAEVFEYNGATYLVVGDDSTEVKAYIWNEANREFDLLSGDEIGILNHADTEVFSEDNRQIVALAQGENIKIHEWSGSNFDPIQTINLSDVRQLYFFEADLNANGDTEDYLAAAAGENLFIYQWQNGEEFNPLTLFATLDTPDAGATNAEYFSVDDRKFLMVTAYKYENGEPTGTYSPLYEWNGTEFVQFEQFWDTGMIAAEFFTMSGVHYLVLATQELVDGSIAGDRANMNIYKYEDDSFLANHVQSIGTKSARDIEYAYFGGQDRLLMAEYKSASNTTAISSRSIRLEHYQNVINNANLYVAGQDIFMTVDNWGSNTDGISYDDATVISSGGVFSFHADQEHRPGWDSPGAAISAKGGYFSGNVGIGTTNPTSYLHVKGSSPAISIENTYTNDDGTVTGRRWGLYSTGGNSSVGGEKFAIMDWSDTSSSADSDKARLVVDKNGNVGIGTTSPARKLVVKDDDPLPIQIEYDGTLGNGSSVGIAFLDNADGSSAINSQIRAIRESDYESGLAFFTKNSTTGTQESFRVYGNGNAWLKGELTENSDSRYKKDIRTLPSALQNILSLRGVSYYWKDGSDTSQHIGVISQEVEKVYPQLVRTDEDGYKSVAYSHLVSPLIEAVKELHALYQGHADRIALLEAQLQERDAELEAQNAEWENHIAHQDERIAHQDELIVQLEVRLAALEAAQ